MRQAEHPSWWNDFHEVAWDNAKGRMRHPRRQTKHDGGHPGVYPENGFSFNPTTGEQILFPDDQATFEQLEPAYRFGFGARVEYGPAYPVWDDDLEIRLARDWRTMNPGRKQTWEQDREAIRCGWNCAGKVAETNPEQEAGNEIENDFQIS